MANTAKPAAETPAAAAPSFVARPMTALPKRETPKTEPDLATANALLAIVSGTSEIDGQQVANTATDGKTFASAEAARKVANSAKRKLEYVVPDGKRVKSRVYGSGTAWEWAVMLADAKPEKPATTAEVAPVATEAPEAAPVAASA